MAQMDKFNKATALILSKLYESFPLRTLISVSDLTEDLEDANLYGDTILFLEREGFISYETRSENKAFSSIALTAKGLAVLNAVPDVLQDNTTFGQRLSRCNRRLKRSIKHTH